jgi:hypothetical protein
MPKPVMTNQPEKINTDSIAPAIARGETCRRRADNAGRAIS